MITIETAQVYKTKRRRYLTLLAACRDEAKERADEKYPCTCDGDVGYTCGNHGEWLSYRDQVAEEIRQQFIQAQNDRQRTFTSQCRYAPTHSRISRNDGRTRQSE